MSTITTTEQKVKFAEWYKLCQIPTDPSQSVTELGRRLVNFGEKRNVREDRKRQKRNKEIVREKLRLANRDYSDSAVARYTDRLEDIPNRLVIDESSLYPMPTSGSLADFLDTSNRNPFTESYGAPVADAPNLGDMRTAVSPFRWINDDRRRMPQHITIEIFQDGFAYNNPFGRTF